MKKIALFVLVTVMAGSLFAYEPKLECVTVKGNKIRYEETYKGFVYTQTRRWAYKIKSGKFIYLRSGTFDSMWSDLLQCRERHDIHLNVAKYKDETCSTCAFLEKYKSAYEKLSSELGLIAGMPETTISSQTSSNTEDEGSSTIPEMEVESSDSKCPTLSE